MLTERRWYWRNSYRGCMAPGSGDGFDRSTDKQMDNVSEIRPESWLTVRLQSSTTPPQWQKFQLRPVTPYSLWLALTSHCFLAFRRQLIERPATRRGPGISRAHTSGLAAAHQCCPQSHQSGWDFIARLPSRPTFKPAAPRARLRDLHLCRRLKAVSLISAIREGRKLRVGKHHPRNVCRDDDNNRETCLQMPGYRCCRVLSAI